MSAQQLVCRTLRDATRWLCLTILVGAGPGVLGAQEESAEDRADRLFVEAEALAEEGALTRALQVFQDAASSLAADPDLRAELTIDAAASMLGLAPDSSRTLALEYAGRLYLDLVEDEEYGADALNGLAAVYRELGAVDDAARQQQRALDAYQVQALTPPYSRAAHDSVVALSLRAPSEGYVDYGWMALAQGRHFAVVDGSLRAMESHAFPEALGGEILTQLAVALAGDSYDARRFAAAADGQRGSDAPPEGPGGRLGGLAVDSATPPPVRAAIDTLVSWHREPPTRVLADGCAPDSTVALAELQALDWWSSTEVRPGAPANAMSPAEAAGTLLVALGNGYQARSEEAAAEELGRQESQAATAYYCQVVALNLAALLGVPVPETRGEPLAAPAAGYAGMYALRDLAWLYVLEEQEAPLKDLHKQFKGAFESDEELIPIDTEVIGHTSVLEDYWWLVIPPIVCILWLCRPDDNTISGTVTVSGN